MVEVIAFAAVGLSAMFLLSLHLTREMPGRLCKRTVRTKWFWVSILAGIVAVTGTALLDRWTGSALESGRLTAAFLAPVSFGVSLILVTMPLMGETRASSGGGQDSSPSRDREEE